MDTHGEAQPFTNILVPLDGSQLADKVLECAIPFALRDKAKLHVLRVTGGPDAQRDGLAREAEEKLAVSHLKLVEERVRKAGVNVSVHVAHGDPVEEIVQLATRLKVDLIAMSSHGRSGVRRWIRGSVAETVLREASSPVLLLSPHSELPKSTPHFSRILVPLAGSERSAAVLPWVIALAQGQDTEVVLLRSEWAGATHPTAAMTLSTEKLAASLQPWQERVEAAGIRVRVIAAHGDAAHEILEAADREQVDLVALSSHGRAGLMRFLEGSVAEKVLRHCSRPLLVVRSKEPG
jgi:nucleotide-binding universal stress UspA family protein